MKQQVEQAWRRVETEMRKQKGKGRMGGENPLGKNSMGGKSGEGKGGKYWSGTRDGCLEPSSTEKGDPGMSPGSGVNPKDFM